MINIDFTKSADTKLEARSMKLAVNYTENDKFDFDIYDPKQPTALDQLIEKESEPDKILNEIQIDMIGRVISFLINDHTDPLSILKNIYAICYVYFPHKIDGKSMKQIADLLGVSKSNINEYIQNVAKQNNNRHRNSISPEKAKKYKDCNKYKKKIAYVHEETFDAFFK